MTSAKIVVCGLPRATPARTCLYAAVTVLFLAAASPLRAEGDGASANPPAGPVAAPAAATAAAVAAQPPVASASAVPAAAPADVAAAQFPVASASAVPAAAPAGVAMAQPPAASASAGPAGVAVVKPPVASPADGPRPAASSPESQLEEEIARLHKLEVELRAVESLPAPSAAASLPAAKPREEKPAPTAADLPKEPLKGFEEEFATALYALGNYDSARVAYRKLLEAKPKPDVQAWARFQIANCAKRAGDFPAAAAAYEELLTTSPTSPWAPEAAWWANEIKWRMRWDQTNP